MLSQKDLEELYIELDTLVVMASENYPAVYKKSPITYSRLRQQEREFAMVLREYFAGLAKRSQHFVNWNRYNDHKDVKAADKNPNQFDIVVTMGSPEWQNEATILLSAVYKPILAQMQTGVNAAKIIYGGGKTPAMDAVQQAAANHAAELVKGLDDTTFEYIKDAISEGLDEGWTYQQMADELNTVLDNPNRAEIIARTESVRAYNSGQLDYAQENDYQSKVWDLSSDPCEYCQANGDVGWINIDDEFPEIDGVDAAPGHPNCRCGDHYSMKANDGAGGLVDETAADDTSDDSEE